MTLHFRKV